MAAPVQPGCMALRRADAPPICGQDMEVPDRRLYFTTRVSSSNFVGEDASLHAANILSPGAVISGCWAKRVFSKLAFKLLHFRWRKTHDIYRLITFRISGEIVLGPLLVKAAMKGAGLVSNTVLAGMIYAFGSFAELMYLRILRAFR